MTTAVFSAQQRGSETRRVADRYEATTEQVATALSSTVSDRIGEFTLALDFVESQGHIDATELRTFLQRRANGRISPIDQDPGLVVAEVVADLATLQERERSQGRSDFTVFSPLPVARSEYHVITHIEQDFPVMGRDFVGFDVSSFSNFLDYETLDEDPGNAVRVAVTTYSDLFGNFRILGETNPPDINDYEDAAFYLLAEYETRNGSTGVVAKLESIGAIVQSAADRIPAETRLQVHMNGGDSPIVEVDKRSTPTVAMSQTLNVSGTSRDEVFDFADLQIRLDASDEFGHDAAVLTQGRLWTIGLAASLVLAGFVALRTRQAQRLIDAGLELELAQTLASTDPLTGLLNRQGMVDAVESPSPAAGALLFLDIDNFKQVNDIDGHAGGDQLLRQIGQAIRASVRASDTVCRLGGDEFLVFLPFPIDASRVDSIRHQITTSVHDLDHRISCSIGTATRSPDQPATLEQLMRRADAAMYEEKRHKGRRSRAE